MDFDTAKTTAAASMLTNDEKNCCGTSNNSKPTKNVFATSSDNKSFKGVKMMKKENNTNAKKNWRLLARAILSNNSKLNVELKQQSLVSDMSQLFTGFDLVQVDKMQQTAQDEENFTIKIDIGCNRFDCNVHIEKLWTLHDLIGFNNTGNVTFWTSEAALTYYVLENLSMFKDSWVLEIGGGMFCLSALMLAKYSDAFLVHLTDGNHRSLINVRKSLRLNDDLRTFVKSSG